MELHPHVRDAVSTLYWSMLSLKFHIGLQEQRCIKEQRRSDISLPSDSCLKNIVQPLRLTPCSGHSINLCEILATRSTHETAPTWSQGDSHGAVHDCHTWLLHPPWVFHLMIIVDYESYISCFWNYLDMYIYMFQFLSILLVIPRMEELLHHQKDSWNPITNGIHRRFQLAQDFATIHRIITVYLLDGILKHIVTMWR